LVAATFFAPPEQLKQLDGIQAEVAAAEQAAIFTAWSRTIRA